jgi:hypothetical protein
MNAFGAVVFEFMAAVADAEHYSSWRSPIRALEVKGYGHKQSVVALRKGKILLGYYLGYIIFMLL